VEAFNNLPTDKKVAAGVGLVRLFRLIVGKWAQSLQILEDSVRIMGSRRFNAELVKFISRSGFSNSGIINIC